MSGLFAPHGLQHKKSKARKQERVVGALIPEVCEEICYFENLGFDNELEI